MTDLWRTYLSKTLLGRLRLKLYKEIRGTADVLPTDREVRRYLLRRYRENAFAAEFDYNLLYIGHVNQARFASLTMPIIPELVRTLESQPLESPQFVEIIECPEPLPPISGAVVRCEHQQPAGYVYTVILVDELHFPAVGYFEVRAFAHEPSPLIRMLTPSGPVVLDDNYSEYPEAEFVFRILNYFATNRRFEFLPPEMVSPERAVTGLFEGPEDPELVRLLRLVRATQVGCAELSVPISSVRPFSTQFCLRIANHEIKEFARELERNHPRLLVYWNGEILVTSDDYVPYLAYRYLGVDRVPVTIIGAYPAELGLPERTGGWELIPAIGIDRRREALPEDPDAAELILQGQLERSKRGPVPGELYAFFMILAELIQNPSTTERDIHNFLHRYPTALDVYGREVLSEVWLGREYRIDLVLQYRTAERQIALIELESPRKALFTKAGRLRAEITHALQQVEDWLRWWREHPADVPAPLDPSVSPKGMVIVGRKRGLSADDQRRLAHLNDTRDVKLLTYDDLLDQLEAMIETVEAVYD